MNRHQLQKIAQWLLYATAVVPVIFLSDYFYPFVVPRTVFFRIAVGVALILFIWLWGAGKMKINHDLKKSELLMSGALALYLLAYVLATLFGVAPLNSLYGDMERSWGLYTILHVCVFYVLARSFFGRREWHMFFRVATGAVLLVALYGIIQRFALVLGLPLVEAGASRIPSTLGNPAFAAITLVFGMACAVYLRHVSAVPKIRHLYLGIVLVQAYAFLLTDIRGTYLGVIAGLMVGCGVYAWLGASKKARRSIVAVLGLMIIAGAFIFSFRETAFIRELPIAGRLASISPSDSTAITRLIGWRAAWNGFLKNPILGVGPENFGKVFNEHFDPVYYTYASTEPFFDRAHNNFLDILATTGTLGFVSYLLLFGAAGYYLWSGYCRKQFSAFELGICCFLIVAYAVHLFFVFDELTSFVFFVALLGYLEYAYSSKQLYATNTQRKRNQSLKTVFALLAVCAVVWFGISKNYAIIRASGMVIDGVALEKQGELARAGERYQRAITIVHFMPRKTLLTPYIDYVVLLANSGKAGTGGEYAALFNQHSADVLSALEQEIERAPHDPILYSKTATVHTARYVANRNEAEAMRAISYTYAAIQQGPNRPQYYNLLSESYVTFGEPFKAVEAAEASISLNKNYSLTHKILVHAYMAATIESLRQKQYEQAIGFALKSVEYDEALKGEAEYIVSEIRAGRAEEVLRTIEEP